MRGLVTAIRTLTVVPVPGPEAGRPASALPWFPLVGAALGAVAFGIARGCESLCAEGAPFHQLRWPAGVAVLVLGSWTWLTGALHLDGLADWADGRFGARDRERALVIMKDSRIGAFGAIALVLVLVAKWAALARIIEHPDLLGWLVTVPAVSRFAQVELAVSLPYARPEGGTAAAFVNGARLSHRLVALLLAAGAAIALAGPAGIGGLVVGWALARLHGRGCRRRFGGVTGDLLGAGSELIETALLFIVAAAGPALAGWTGWSWLGTT
jgi:adenosylcobinamide-GDP ribazoletransferase